MQSEITIRRERPEDRPSVHKVNSLAFSQAFGHAGEADLVDALREEAHPYISLVALLGGRVVGHIFFSPVTIEDEDSRCTAMGLAPMAVLPEHQGRGIGSRLVRQGLEECRRDGHNIVVVLGHPDYYPRFGFEPAAPKGIRSEYDVTDDKFMVAELEPGALADRKGIVKYHAAFARF
jgi:putative acetyltransferase